MFGGGGGKEGEVPSAKEYYAQAKEYYANYSQWTKDETDRYNRDIASNNARYSAGGGRGDNEYLDTLNKARETSYHDAMKDLERGEHGSFLTAYFNETKESMKGSLADYAAPGAMTAKGAYRNRGDNMFGSQEYFKPSQVAMDARKATDDAQDQVRRFTSNSSAPGSTPGARQDWASVGASGGIGGVGSQGMIDQGNSMIASTRGTFEAERNRIDALTMDDLFGAEFGAADTGPSLEEQAIDRANQSAGGRQAARADDPDEKRSAWWG